MKKIFLADKSSYGGAFCAEFDTLEELKRGIVMHELRRKLESEDYTEDLFNEISGDYTLYEVDLHDDEYISWSEYDGQSDFSIEKRDMNRLSIIKCLSEDEGE